MRINVKMKVRRIMTVKKLMMIMSYFKGSHSFLIFMPDIFRIVLSFKPLTTNHDRVELPIQNDLSFKDGLKRLFFKFEKYY
jgi:hypothetical protein